MLGGSLVRSLASARARALACVPVEAGLRGYTVIFTGRKSIVSNGRPCHRDSRDTLGFAKSTRETAYRPVFLTIAAAADSSSPSRYPSRPSRERASRLSTIADSFPSIVSARKKRERERERKTERRERERACPAGPFIAISKRSANYLREILLEIVGVQINVTVRHFTYTDAHCIERRRKAPSDRVLGYTIIATGARRAVDYAVSPRLPDVTSPE